MSFLFLAAGLDDGLTIFGQGVAGLNDGMRFIIVWAIDRALPILDCVRRWLGGISH